MKILRDYHIHTEKSACGHASNQTRAILDKVANLGYDSIGLSDHLHPGTDRKIFQQVKGEIQQWREQNAQVPMEVLIGCEADVLAPGVVTIDLSFATIFDYVIVSPNHYHLAWVEKPPCKTATLEQCIEHLLATHLTAANPPAQIIAHPFTYGCSRFAELVDHLDADRLWPLIHRAKVNQVAMEISSGAVNSPHQEFVQKFYTLCLENGVKLCPGSDAHRLEDVGELAFLESYLERLGAGPENLLRLHPKNKR